MDLMVALLDKALNYLGLHAVFCYWLISLYLFALPLSPNISSVRVCVFYVMVMHPMGMGRYDAPARYSLLL